VIATGSRWNDPVELHTNSKAEAIAFLEEQRMEVANAKNIVIVGAGAVGLGIML